MKVKSSLIAPIVAVTLLAPAVGTAVANHTTDSTKTPVSAKQVEQKEGHHESEKGEKQKELTNIINQYATPQLKDQLTKDLAACENLMKQLRQTPVFQKKEAQEKTQRQANYQAHKQEIDAIKQKVKDGKLTKQQAHKQLEALFEKKERNQENDKAQEKASRQELKAAVQKKDQAAINTGLQKIDQELQSSIQQLQQQINANK
ncbi:hypothetical protein [Neobacillus ginsengisoli]|uniref:DNA repair exonuclease SbcCD ATPase subunit n=1 Tax=Neobacillus ginsengisoli TaxID=904295 RepID=A0ABT9Y3F9_9BACI|nr:hypothetical protein [Neobacillus ginsengisoli]MDQ0201689.1 DNA repair exonuclease SbcCD ATPase subunit [Neobacillus ginsengisoli]